MGKPISQLPAATNLLEADRFEIEQSGASKSASKALLRQWLFRDPGFSFLLPQHGDVLVYNGSDFRPGAPSRWRTVPVEAYTEAAPASSSTITFAGGAAANGIALRGGDYFAVGDPARVEIGAGIYYYAMVSAVTDTLLTLDGPAMPLSTILSLAVGLPSMVKHVDLAFPETTYNTLGAAVPVNKGFLHRWRGRAGWLVAFSCSHMSTSATTVVNVKLNGGSNAATTGVTVPAGTATAHGPFSDTAAGDLIRANCAVFDKQDIEAVVTTAGGSANYLKMCLTFIVP